VLLEIEKELVEDKVLAKELKLVKVIKVKKLDLVVCSCWFRRWANAYL
jgi:hypothetical protein